MRRNLRECFKEEASRVHNNKYGYDKVNYITNKIPVIITCPIHGDFKQQPENHLNGQGCPLCWKENRSNRRKGCKIKSKPIYNKGVCDILSRDSNGKPLKSYKTWCSMFVRCYSKIYQKTEPTYIGCEVCEEWLRFSNFKKWFDKNYKEGYELDKDVLVKGNKLYSPNTCCFIPKEINRLLINCKRKRGNYPVGISYVNGKYIAHMRKNKKQIHLGTFNTTKEAFNAYKESKELYIKQLANDFYLKGKITLDVYKALLNYSININD